MKLAILLEGRALAAAIGGASQGLIIQMEAERH